MSMKCFCFLSAGKLVVSRLLPKTVYVLCDWVPFMSRYSLAVNIFVLACRCYMGVFFLCFQV